MMSYRFIWLEVRVAPFGLRQLQGSPGGYGTHSKVGGDPDGGGTLRLVVRMGPFVVH